MKHPNILLFSNSYPPVLGGLQTVAHQLAQGLITRGHAVQVIANRYPRSLPSKEVLEGVPVRRLLFLTPDATYLQHKRPDLFLASFYYFPRARWHLNRIFLQFQPNVVNVHYPLTQIPFVLWLRKHYKFRLVVSLHGDEILSVIRENKRAPALHAILQQADAVTTCSQWLLKQAIQWEPAVEQKGIAIHNGIDLQRFAVQTPYFHPRPYILAFGRLSYQKGFDLLLHAYARVISDHPDVDLILAGDGEERSALQKQAVASGLDGRVHFFGRATPEEVVQLLHGCSFVVIPSRWEPFGIVALEAMAAGKPVLATNVGGLPELLNQPKTRSLLVPPTVEGLASGLREMLAKREGWPIPNHNHNAHLAKFTWDRVVAQYLEIFEN